MSGRLQIFGIRAEYVHGVSPFPYITKLGRIGEGEGEFLLPSARSAAIAVDRMGRIYVADVGADDRAVRVQVFGD